MLRNRTVSHAAHVTATLLVALSTALFLAPGNAAAQQNRKPNLVYVFADQWRAAAMGYAGDPNARTPNLDKLAAQSANFTNAVSGCSVCCPHRASLLTGQFPLTHGVFMNDLHLSEDATTIAEVMRDAGYNTGYIGKWHLDGRGRSSYIPPESRQGFEYWRVLECTHNYNHSPYYADDDKTRRLWEGYDAFAQTDDAIGYIKDHAKADKPFVLFLSWGPPHNPYQTAPKEYVDMFDPAKLTLRPNVPADAEAATRKDLAGYYAHCAALDHCIGELLKTLDETGIASDTIFVFSADHGAMLGSQAQHRKQKPWDESIRVPLLVRYPRALGESGRELDAPISTPDLMPTLLGLAGIGCPSTVEGLDYSGYLRTGQNPPKDYALIECPAPFGEWARTRGGREYRGIRTRRYTYVRDLNGPWLLYDNETDPYQMRNLVDDAASASTKAELDKMLSEKLRERKDEFLPADEYIKKWGYKVDKSGTVPYTN
ncbi:MAG: sulfatase-like hydrolase/transferase [Phycisphaera sp.]|nr:sulfatase-like hydrolase/transferase [Phycisphaera sp.]